MKDKIDITKARLFFEKNKFWRSDASPEVIVIPQLDYFNALLYFLETNINVIPEWDEITFFMESVSRCSENNLVNIGPEIQFYTIKKLDIIRNFLDSNSFWNLDDFCESHNLDKQFCMKYFDELELELQFQFRKEKQSTQKKKLEELNNAKIAHKKEMRKSEIGFIYIISDGEKCKIGKTSNVNNRLQQLQVSNPNELKILISKEIIGYHFVEELLHQEFFDKRISGEWFTLEEQDIDDIQLILDAHGK